LSPSSKRNNDLTRNFEAPQKSEEPERSFKRLFSLGDLIISLPSRRLVLWRNSTSRNLRSGDILLVRLAAGSSFIAVLAAYILNYILLGSAAERFTYYWIMVQVIILGGRYWVWSGKRGWMHERHRGLLYLVSNRICAEDALPLIPEFQPFTRSAELSPPPMQGIFATDGDSASRPRSLVMDRDFIRFCVGAGCSKLSNSGVSELSNNLKSLLKLAGSAPRDILTAPTYSLSHIPEAERSQYNLLRLPWATMEEFYLAQGIVLGPNPLSYAGLFMAAILRNGTFVGVTTIHPFQAPGLPKCKGLTMDGCKVLGSLVDGRLGVCHGVDGGMTHHHESFRENIKRCRSSSESNGPSHVELHAIYQGQYFEYQQVIPTIEEALKKVEGIAEKAAEMTNHDECSNSQCDFYGLKGKTF
jgi:hypothetical protein